VVVLRWAGGRVSLVLDMHAALAALPVGTYRLGADDPPDESGDFESDCSGGLGRAATLLGLSDGRRWTTSTLFAAVGGKLRTGQPTVPGAVGFWNGRKHVMLWSGEEWWGYHGAAGTRAGMVGATYWSSKYDGWAVLPAFSNAGADALRTLASRPDSWDSAASRSNHLRVAVAMWRAGGVK
jgi:hypothetical protein